MRNEVLRLEKVTLREQGVTQLDNFNLHIFEGEIMGLVPVDTHGLSTLCDLLRENLPLYYGYVFYRERLINTWRSPQPRYNRISVIQAKSSLVDGVSVSDKVGAAVASAAGSVANTVLCLGALVLIYGADLTALINNMISAGSADAAYLNDAGAWLVAVVGLPNGLSEAVVAAVIVPMIKIAVEAVTRRAPAGRARQGK